MRHLPTQALCRIGCLVALVVSLPSLAWQDLQAQTPNAPEGALVKPQGTSLLGDPLVPGPASEDTLAKLRQAREAYKADPRDADAIIWLGRRFAYAGQYRMAIRVFTRGIAMYPEDPRFYRHRGHRFITLREFHNAIADLEEAARLMAGQPDATEPDGLPNALGIPISSLHTNVWYHLGLAYYLVQDWANAERAFRAGLAAGRNDDNLVSVTHWLAMILRRTGRDDELPALLTPVTPELEIIENQVYQRLCLYYRGLIPAAAVSPGEGDNPTGAAAAYGLANWLRHGDDPQEGLARLQAIVNGDRWAAFGVIAAEADLAAIQ